VTRRSFQDHFSGHAEQYARHRPTYPPALFAYLAEVAPARRLAWDCATGNGQAAGALAAHFDRVVATDASPEQIAAATARQGVEYRVEPAEGTSLEAASCDLVTVAQALHWFDRPRFYAEVRRVIRRGGVLAVWAYDLMRVTPVADGLIDELAQVTVAAYWPPERRLVDERYATIGFPFAELPAPELDMTLEWTVEACLAYLRTWSAVRRFAAAQQRDPVAAVEAPLRRAWGGGRREVRWPLVLRTGRVEGC
jgi:SAM-dependent methyltransferase